MKTNPHELGNALLMTYASLTVIVAVNYLRFHRQYQRLRARLHKVTQ